MGIIDKHRKAAMHVHYLSDNDKQWVLARLDEGEKRVINEHLHVLESLSVPKDRKFIAAAIEELDEKSEKELYDVLNRSVLTDIEKVLELFEQEPAWVGACLKLEYPGLVESYLVPKMSKLKSREIDKFINQAEGQFTDKFKSTVFEAVLSRLRVLIPTLENEHKNIEFTAALKRAV